MLKWRQDILTLFYADLIDNDIRCFPFEIVVGNDPFFEVRRDAQNLFNFVTYAVISILLKVLPHMPSELRILE